MLHVNRSAMYCSVITYISLAVSQLLNYCVRKALMD